MSWSLSAVGKSEAVAEKVAADFAKITYLQGDEAVLKDAAAEIVAKAIASQSPGTAVNVACNGSASTSGDTKTQSISISVTPIYGFVP